MYLDTNSKNTLALDVQSIVMTIASLRGDPCTSLAHVEIDEIVMILARFCHYLAEIFLVTKISKFQFDLESKDHRSTKSALSDLITKGAAKIGKVVRALTNSHELLLILVLFDPA